MKLRHYVAAALGVCLLGAIAEIAGLSPAAATYGVYGGALVVALAMLQHEPRTSRRTRR